MILIELVVNIVKRLYYYVARFIIWFITARDCRHCKYWNGEHWIYGCNKTNWIPTKVECLNSPYRKHFEREKRG